MSSRDVRWPRGVAWPELRRFDQKAMISAIESTTVSSEEEMRNYDPATKSIEIRKEVHHVPSPSWPTLIPRPELTSYEALLFYSVLWKAPAASIEKVAKAKMPINPLDRVREDLREHVTTPWFDARAYWCCVAALLTREGLAQFVGDARVFVHSYQDGGTSIITGYSDRLAFIEAFYQVVAPHLDDGEWKLVAKEVGSITPSLLADLSSELATQRLRMAAATGAFDAKILPMLDAAAKADVDVYDVLHALRDPSHLATHAPRLKCYLLSELRLDKWIDRFGAEHSDWIVTSIRAASSKKDAAPLVATLARLLPATDAAPIMKKLVGCKAGTEVEKWLARHAKTTGMSTASTSAKTPPPKSKSAKATPPKSKSAKSAKTKRP